MTDRINIAILSAGRRVELVQAFMEQAGQLLPDARIIAVDMKPALSSACHVAHQAEQCPAATSPDYVRFLDDLIERRNIGLIIPTIDTDLQLLADNRERWATERTFVSVSDANVVAACRDKRHTGALFEAISIRYPEIYTASNIRFPAFAKPVSGSSSIGARRVEKGEAQLQNLLADRKLMVMEYIGLPYREYSVDAYFDKTCTFVAAVPRLRIETRAGEISKGLTAKNGLYRKLAETLRQSRGMRGCITLQVFYDEASDDVVGLEINPRFGGGFPLSYAAGANFPGWLIEEYLCGKTPAFFDGWDDRLMMLRYDAKILVKNASL